MGGQPARDGGSYNALDRMWSRLDELTDELIRLQGHSSARPTALRAQAAEVAWCIAGFYGRDVDRVREMAMSRRALREKAESE